MSYIKQKQIKVSLDFGSNIISVGQLATRDGVIYFEYDNKFLQTGLNISPFKIPLETGLQTFNSSVFEGLAGVFSDSLPDGWGRLLFDRYMRSQNILPSELSTLDRLAHVGTSGLGALVYEPDKSEESTEAQLDLDLLASYTQEVIDGEAEGVLQELINLNGSSAGARPKALIGVDKTLENIIHGNQNLPFSHAYWMVKFPNTQDGIDAGAIEYAYSIMAKEAGIEMMDTYLFPAQKGPGYFATKRFDRNHSERYHVHTASGLLHSDFRIPILDYENLLELTAVLTKDAREVEKMYRLAVFNVLSHNRDDHGKNFTFIMNDHGEWKLSPAYDLTFSSGPRGHQSTMVLGEGQNPTKQDLIRLAEGANLKKPKVNQIIDQVESALSQWTKVAEECGVGKSNVKLILERLRTKTV